MDEAEADVDELEVEALDVLEVKAEAVDLEVEAMLRQNIMKFWFLFVCKYF